MPYLSLCPSDNVTSLTCRHQVAWLLFALHCRDRKCANIAFHHAACIVRSSVTLNAAFYGYDDRGWGGPRAGAFVQVIASCKDAPHVVQMAVTRRILREEGQRGLWSGVRARVLFHSPAAAISWGVYESMKRMLSA